MKLIMVRHGEPDYKNDCLTETGKLQAAAAANRLACENISAIYSSPRGRAKETASYTASKLGLPVTILDFMAEISWGGENVPENGHPWTLSDRMIAEESFDFSGEDWREHPFFQNNKAVRYEKIVTDGFKAFLGSRGYEKEGIRFRCTAKSEETIALFSHGGSGAYVISYLLNLPFPYVCSVMPYHFASVTAIELPQKYGEFVRPRLILFNDVSHLVGSSILTEG